MVNCLYSPGARSSGRRISPNRIRTNLLIFLSHCSKILRIIRFLPSQRSSPCAFRCNRRYRIPKFVAANGTTVCTLLILDFKNYESCGERDRASYGLVGQVTLATVNYLEIDRVIINELKTQAQIKGGSNCHYPQKLLTH